MESSTKGLLIIIALLQPVWLFAQYNVKEFGAKGDGISLDTRAIQQAIDKAAENHGGVVEVPAGTYIIGSLFLKDNVNLNLQAGSILLGSPDINDYTAANQRLDSRTKNLYAKYFMLFAEDVKNFSITGSGTIHGNGVKNFQAVRPQNMRPVIMRLVNCQNVLISGIHLLESANWTFHLLQCLDVTIKGIIIENTARGNRDGLDIDGCERVTVSDSRFLTTDDAIVLKASGEAICRDIAVTNCIMRTTGSAFKTGTESNGGFKNITVSNCVFKDVPNHAGIELMTVDGGIMQNILIENITMENVKTPFFIRIGNRARPYKTGQYVNKIDDVKDIYLNNISVLNAKEPSSIMGMHSKRISNVTISNYTVRNAAASETTPYNKVFLAEPYYPMAAMFKNLPAYAIYCRNVDELHLQNIVAYPAENEKRAALCFDRVSNLELFGVKAAINNTNAPLAHFRNSQNVIVSFCRTLTPNKMLFEIEEKAGARMAFSGNMLFPNQKETVKVAALTDNVIFEDFDAAFKYTVENGPVVKGLKSHGLNETPFAIQAPIAQKESAQLRLLVLNVSEKPKKIFIQYNGVVQEFLVNWKDWGWAPITLIGKLAIDHPVHFDITAEGPGQDIKMAKAYLIPQDTELTD